MKKFALMTVMAAGLAAAASAGIVSVGGDAQLIAQPGDARLNQLVSNPKVFVWNEAQNFLLGSNVRADAVNPGLYDQDGDLANVQIASGTVIHSHYIHFDSAGATAADAVGSVTFDNVILGVIAINEPGSRHMDQSDFLGAPTLFSANVNARGLELSPNGDRFRISADGKTVEFNFRITTPGDYMRVITAVPTPGALALTAAAGLVGLRRRR